MVSIAAAFRSNKSTSKSKSSNIPPTFICPITKEIMIHPVMNKYGQSYERTAIIEWITETNGPTCPVTKDVLHVKDLLPNTKLRNEIVSWMEAKGDDTSSYHVDDGMVREVEVIRALHIALSPEKKPKKNVLGMFKA